MENALKYQPVNHRRSEVSIFISLINLSVLHIDIIALNHALIAVINFHENLFSKCFLFFDGF